MRPFYKIFLFLILFFAFNCGVFSAENTDKPLVAENTVVAGADKESETVFASTAKMPQVHPISANWLNPEKEPEKPGAFSMFMRSAASLLIVLGLLIGFMWIVKLLWFSRKSGPEQFIEVLARHQLTANASLCVVKVKERILLLGIGDDVNLICELTEAPKSAFKNLLEGYANQRPPANTENAHASENAYGEFVNEIKHHLDDLKSAIKRRIR